MSDNRYEFTKDNIDLYFKELSKEYKKLGGRGFPIEITLIGGAAIVESYGFRSMTTDIDAILPSVGILKDAINNIGDRYGLPNGWLNADFMQTSSYSPKLSQYSKPYKTFNQVLNVRYISGEYLIAMKLKSAREYKNDLSDIIGILAEQEQQQNPISLEAVFSALENLYGDSNQISESALSFLNDIYENGNYQQLYDNIRKNEQDTRDVLIKFDRKYPNVLKEDNLDEVITSRREKESIDSVQLLLKSMKKESKNQK